MKGVECFELWMRQINNPKDKMFYFQKQTLYNFNVPSYIMDTYTFLDSFQRKSPNIVNVTTIYYNPRLKVTRPV